VLRGLGKFEDYSFSRPNAIDTRLTDKDGNVITVRGVEKFSFADGDKTLDDLRYNLISVGNDKLQASSADTLDGGAGADTLTGRDGDDVYLIDNSGDVIVEAADEGTDEARSRWRRPAPTSWATTWKTPLSRPARVLPST
jgi:Ca2+-binding RTX toxin-like protein